MTSNYQLVQVEHTNNNFKTVWASGSIEYCKFALDGMVNRYDSRVCAVEYVNETTYQIRSFSFFTTLTIEETIELSEDAAQRLEDRDELTVDSAIIELKQLTMETHYMSSTDAVCQLREINSSFLNGIGKIVWGCFFNPCHDGSIDTMADERSAYLVTNNAEIVWPE